MTQQDMNDLLRLATIDLAQFLGSTMPQLSPDWWQKNVVERLSFSQQRTVQERRIHTLQQLDFAALLRVVDQNWYELSSALNLPREGRNWVKELQHVRNKWAHLSAEAIPPGELYRDADTLGRLLLALGSPSTSMQAVESRKDAALEAMAATRRNPPEENIRQPEARNAQTTSTDSPVGQNPATPPSIFKAGDLVALRSEPKVLLPVIEVIPGGAENRYRVFQNNGTPTYYESQLQAAPLIVADEKVLGVRELHAHLTSLQILAPSTANLFSLRSGRVKFVPYQYRPVLKLIRADRPRLLIADEVGVGKTIEAGLIIRELQARMDITSVLVICPKALVAERKWFAEMKRFDEHFSALDGPMLRHCLQETHLEGEWPEQYSKAIVPFSLFDSDLIFGRDNHGRTKGEGLLALDPPPRFDLVIVDEAHHIRNAETFVHQGVRYFCDNAQAVLLLTATPVQLGSDDLFTLLNVLRPDLIIDHASFEQMAEPNPYINEAIGHCRKAGADWQQTARACLEKMTETEFGRLFIRETPTFQETYDRLLESDLGDSDRLRITRTLEELYTFSPFINRTRRRDIGEFTTRKPETISIDFTDHQKRLHDGLLDVIARILIRCHGQQNVKFMMTTIRRQAASCLYGLVPLLSDILSGKLDRLEMMEVSDSDQEIDPSFAENIRADVEALLEQARNLDPHDPKIEAFIRVLLDKNKRPNNKALVFSTFRHTLAYLYAHARRAGMRVGLIHGDVVDAERASLRSRFALPAQDPDAIDVLLSSEVGCEGLDFQFCDFLVNYDLPWNPMRIEQRIGRIDRYGQKSEAVAIINFVTPGTVDADIYERCLWRIGVFQHAVGGSEEILGTITRQIHDIAESFSLNAEERAQQLQQLADNEIRIIREEEELESRESELFGLNIPGHSWRDDVKAAETFWLSSSAIEHAVTVYLTGRLDGDLGYLLGEKPLKTLRLNQDARHLLLEDFRKLPRSIEPISRQWDKWLKGDEPTLSITFEQESAADNAKAVHLSVVHPLVRQAARFLEITKPKFFRLAATSTDDCLGVHHFAIYRWTKHGIKTDDLLIAVADDERLEKSLFDLLRTAGDSEAAPLPNNDERNALDARHHSKWTEAQANHIGENRQLVENRIHSLTVSHRARCKAIEDQMTRTTNDKIRVMKQSELARANTDFDRRMSELQQAANTGDIRTTPVVFGTITLTKDPPK